MWSWTSCHAITVHDGMPPSRFVYVLCLQVRQWQAWEAYGYEQGFWAGIDCMRSLLQGPILANRNSQCHQNARQALLQVWLAATMFSVRVHRLVNVQCVQQQTILCTLPHCGCIRTIPITSNTRTAVRSVCSCKIRAWSSLNLGFQTIPAQEAFHRLLTQHFHLSVLHRIESPLLLH